MMEDGELRETDAGKLAMDHWRYVEGILIAHGHGETTIKMVAYHYITAFQHGWKHAMEAVAAMPMPSISTDSVDCSYGGTQ